MITVAVVALSAERAGQIADALRRQGIQTAMAPAADVLEYLRESQCDLAVVEYTATTRALLDGLQADKALVERMPLLALTDADSVTEYESGVAVDDFALLPVSPAELGARVRLALRRRRGDEPEHVLRFNDLSIDLANYRVTVAGEHVALTFKEYELLRFLASNRDKVFTREALLNRVWGYDYYGGARTVDVHIRRLRAKIEDGHRTFIETIRNVGYRFRDEP